MSYPVEDTLDGAAIHVIDFWLDGKVASTYQDQPLAQDWARISKVAEELGEAIQAFIGYTGQNPRKGITHIQDEVLRELADVVITGTLAIQHFTKDHITTRQIIRDRMDKIYKRACDNGAIA